MTTIRGDLLAGPYVNLATATSARVLWVARAGAEGLCEVIGGGEDGSQAKVDVTASTVAGLPGPLFLARLSGLRPGCTYRYVVRSGADGAEGAFQTLPAKGAAGALKFVSYSDPQDSPQRHASVAEAICKELPFAFLSISGDLSNDGAKWDFLRAEFFEPARDLLRQTAIWTARGNHEMEAVLFRDLFALPEQPLLSFDAGGLHFVLLDPYCSGGLHRKGKDEMADMLALLERDLASARADWIVVTYHDPTFNIGGTGSEWGRKDLLPVLEKHGVDVVLCGHAHLYERCRPIGPRGGKPVIHITHGGGGGPSYPLAPSPLLEASYSGLHYCVFTVEGNRLEMAAKLPTGETIDRMVLLKTRGAYPKEVMDRAVETAVAMGLAKVFKLQRAVFDRVPPDGDPCPALIQAANFPAGCTVSMEAASGCPWAVRRVTFVGGDEAADLIVTAPPDTRLAATPWMGCFEPELKLKVTVTEGRTSSTCDGVPVLIPADCLARLHPAPRPVDVPPAPPGLVVAGDLAGWKGAEGLFLPSTQGPSDALRLAWNKDGLWGALRSRTGAIQVNRQKPWEGDCLELNFETDNARRLSISPEAKAGKIVLYPAAEEGQGPAGFVVPVGPWFQDRPVTAVWRKTGAGYDMEFFLPSATLAPADFRPGGTMGFDYVLRQGGRVVEQFIDASRIGNTWACPFFWGKLRLAGE